MLHEHIREFAQYVFYIYVNVPAPFAFRLNASRNRVAHIVFANDISVTVRTDLTSAAPCSWQQLHYEMVKFQNTRSIWIYEARTAAVR
jgi:hypothetical protein